MNKIAIIGGGASGMMAAITTAKEGAFVTIFEKKDRIGKKILATGNGKCNFSNLENSMDNYSSNSQRDLSEFFNQFNTADTVGFFESLGMFIKNKNNYLYPASEQATTVLDLLRIALDEYGVIIKTNVVELKITPKNTGDFFIDVAGEREKFNKIIICCGGMAGEKKQKGMYGYDYGKQFGHTLIPIVPSLVQLRCKEDFFKSIAGIRTDASMELYIDHIKFCKERGELQLTDYGISGIPVFQLSRYAALGLKEKKKVTVMIDFFPDYSKLDLEDKIRQRFVQGNKKTVEEFYVGLLPKKLCAASIRLAQLKSTNAVSSYSIQKIVDAILGMKAFQVTVIATNPFENAQVCAGGISIDEVSGNLESKLVPNLYFAGEVLDVDGRCGGYNLQWAWTSGFIVGKNSSII